MILQPRRFKFKTRQKKRRATQPAQTRMSYGTMGLVIQKPFRISAKRIFRLKLSVKKSARKSDITRRSFWMSVFPHLPLSRKTKGMRMGKGAGKLSTWFTELRGGKTILEFKNLRLGRALYFAKRVHHKLPVPTHFITCPTRNLKLVSAKKTNPALFTFW